MNTRTPKSTLSLLATAVVAAMSLSLKAAETFTITSDGKPETRIVTGENPPEPVAFAAKELQTYVKKMSGAELPIVAKAPAGKPSILLGPAAREKLDAKELKEIKRDGYIITVRDNDLCVVGIDDKGPKADIEALLEKKITHDVVAWNFHRGTLYGVYRLLEDLGVRWYMPGEFGERVPDKKTIAFSGDIRESPKFITRTVGYWSLGGLNAYNKNRKKITIMPGEREEIGFSPVENRLWELRMRGETFRIPLNHNPPRAAWSQRFAEKHPDYFAILPDGTRADKHGGHLCYTNPGVIKENIEDIKAFVAGKNAKERGIELTYRGTNKPRYPFNRGWSSNIALENFYSLLPNDGFRACTCPSCSKKIPKNLKLANQKHTKLVWDFVSECAEAVPEANLVCLAYGSYAIPYPGMKKLPPNVIVGFCAYSNPASLLYKNAFEKYKNLMTQWDELSEGPLAFWQHYLSANRNATSVGMPEHTPEMYARCARLMAKHGEHVFCEQMADSIMFELFNRYLLLKLFYNPQLDPNEIFQDFVNGFYGPDAGPIIGEIYADIGRRNVEKIKNRAGQIDYWTKYYPADVIKGYHAKAAEAAKKAAGTKYEKAVKAFDKFYLGLMDKGLAHFDATMGKALSVPNPELTSHYEAKAPELDGKLDEPAWKEAKAIPMIDVNTGEPSSFPTEVKSFYDDDNVYFGVVAHDPEAKKLKRISDQPGLMDAIEIFLDTNHDHEGYYQMTFDLADNLDQRHYIDKIEPVRLDWRSHAKWKTAINDDSYVMEIAIPRDKLEKKDKDLSKETWGVLLGRTVSRIEKKDGKFSCTSAILRKRFHQPNLFNNMVFEK